MEQNCFFISNQLAYQFWFFHLLHHSIRKGIKIRSITAYKIFIHSGLLKLFISYGRISDWHPTIALPPIICLQTFLSRYVLDSISLKMQFQEISFQIYGYRSICFSFGQIFNKNIGDEVNAATKGTVVVVKFFCRNRWIL